MSDDSFCCIYILLKHFLYDLAFRKHFSCRFELKLRYTSWIHYSRKTSTKRRDPLGHLCPFVASVVRELSQLPCAGHPRFVLADAAVELLQHPLFISYYFVANCCLKKICIGTEMSIFRLKKQIIERMRKSENF